MQRSRHGDEWAELRGVTNVCSTEGGGGELAFFSFQTTEFTPNTDDNTRNKSWQTTGRTEELQLQLQLPSSA